MAGDLKPKAHAGGIPVWCDHSEIVDIAALKPNPRNPNRHPKAQIELLGKVIRAQGWRAPITVSRRSGFIVRGHGRLEAAILIGAGQAPADYQDYESDAAEWADLIADNRIAELAEFETDGLLDLFGQLESGGLDVELTGFTKEEIAELLDDRTPENIDELLRKLEIEKAVEKPLWLVVRTAEGNRGLLEQAAAVLEKAGIRVERNYAD